MSTSLPAVGNSGSPAAPSRSNPSETPGLPDSANTLPPVQIRKKRNQVSRACESCRIHRLKCDDHYPCSNCTKRGVRCNNSGASKLSTLPQAHREIEALRQKVETLELELKNARRIPQNNEVPTPASLESPPPGGYSEKDTGPRLGLELTGKATTSWSGIHIRTARSQQTTWFGPSSLFHFIGRVSAFLSKSHLLTHSAAQMLPNSASQHLYAPVTESSEEISGPEPASHRKDHISNRDSTPTYLSSTQEEYFLDLFWQTYHVVYPILNEAEFKKHYQSLWITGTNERKPSAIVEIMLALCLQYGMALAPNNAGRTGNANVDSEDATIAGRWHYQRCQTLLAAELETPTLTTIQCHILCSIYLCCGSFINMADGACGLAARTAYMMGLHVDPPESMPQAARELRRRIWWTLYVLESKMSMKLGRPFLLRMSDSTCALPSDRPEIAALSGSNFSRLAETATWLTFTLQNTKLLLVCRAIHSAFYDYDGLNSIENESMHSGDIIWNNAELLESRAKVSSSRILQLSQWAEGVPSTLRMNRQNGGTPLSTDLTPLAIEQFSPLWVQRQRLLLELMYHNLSVNICRVFISFAPKTTNPALTAVAERIATKSAAHACALTRIMHQVLTETTMLHGWHETFQWQWNSAVTLVGFLLSQPRVEHQESIANARIGVDLAVEVLEKFGESFAVAASAAGIIKHLSRVLATVATRERSAQNILEGQVPEIASDISMDQAHAFQSHQMPGPTGNDFYGDVGPGWLQNGFVDGHSIYNSDDEISAQMIADIGQSVTSMFGVEAYNTLDEIAVPYPSNSSNVLYPDWVFT